MRLQFNAVAHYRGRRRRVPIKEISTAFKPALDTVWSFCAIIIVCGPTATASFSIIVKPIDHADRFWCRSYSAV
jgi:hypothetical protein